MDFEPFDPDNLRLTNGEQRQRVHELLLGLLRGYRPNPQEVMDMGELEKIQDAIRVLRGSPTGDCYEFENGPWATVMSVALSQVILTNLALEGPTLKRVLDSVTQER
jgi:hypothetical protein